MSLLHDLAALSAARRADHEITVGSLAIGLRRLDPGDLIALGYSRLALDPGFLAGLVSGGQEPTPAQVAAAIPASAVAASLAESGRVNAAIAQAAVVSLRRVGPDGSPVGTPEAVRLTSSRDKQDPDAGILWVGTFSAAILAKIAAAVRADEAEAAKALTTFCGVPAPVSP